MAVAGLMFALMGVFVKLGARHFSAAELVFYRSLIGLAAVYGSVHWQHLTLATPHWRMHLARGLSGFFALMLFFYALTTLPLATAITLNYTSPLFLALLLILTLRERPAWWLIASLVLGFVGVVLLLDPRFEGTAFLPRLVGLASGFFAGLAYFNVRRLGTLGEPEWRVVFYFTLVCTVAAGIWMGFSGVRLPRVADLPVLLGLGITATLGQLAMTRAWQRGHPLVVGSLAYSTVVFASLMDLVLWNEVLPPTSWLAILLIALSGAWASRAGQPKAMG